MIEKESLVLSGEQIQLRPVCLSDDIAVYEAVRESIAEVSPWMPWCHSDYSREDNRTWLDSREEVWRQGAEYDFLILERATSSLLGVCGLNHFNEEYRFANLGYWIRTSQTGHGFATKATRLLARFAFESLKLNRVEIIVATDNLASQRVALKANAKREGVLRKRLVDLDRVHDAIMYSLIAEDLHGDQGRPAPTAERRS